MQARAHTSAGTGRRTAWGLGLLAFALAALNYLAFGDTHLGLRDEGYLWYGVRAVLAGDVPLRDFQAYDPGRYYWTAAWSPLFGDGVLGVRAASALFQGLGLWAGLSVGRRVLRSPAALTILGLALLLWMFPRHKLYESSLALLGTLVACRFAERPDGRRALEAGVLCGLAACFGRNHGLYLGLGLGLLVLAVPVSAGTVPRAGRLARFALGTLLGYAPLLGMMLAVEGFAAGFVHATVRLLEQGANLPVPYPWPWGVRFEAQALPLVLAEGGVALAFLLPLVVLPAALVALLRTPRDAPPTPRVAVLWAGLFVGVPYAHHYAVRADLSHLAQGLPPVLLLALAFLVGRVPVAHGWRAAAAPGLLFLLGLVVNFGRHPAFTELWKEEPAELVEHEVGGDVLRLRFALARHLGRVEQMVERFVGPEEELFIAPTSPTFYPLLDKRSPDWWIYYLWPASEEEQRRTIERLEARQVPWAMIISKPFDADVSFAFVETNPEVWKYLQTRYRAVVHPIVPEKYTLLRRVPPGG